MIRSRFFSSFFVYFFGILVSKRIYIFLNILSVQTQHVYLLAVGGKYWIGIEYRIVIDIYEYELYTDWSTGRWYWVDFVIRESERVREVRGSRGRRRVVHATARPRGHDLTFTGAWSAGRPWHRRTHPNVQVGTVVTLKGGGYGGDGANWPNDYLWDMAVRN